MYFHTAISKLTLYAYKNPDKEAECLELIELLSKYSIDYIDKQQYCAKTLEDNLKNISGNIFINNSKMFNTMFRFRLTNFENLSTNITPQALDYIADIISLDNKNKELVADFKRIFELGIEEKLDYDLSKYLAIIKTEKMLERTSRLSKIADEELNIFPFIRVAQSLVKEALTLKEISDAKQVERALPDFKKSIKCFTNFKKVNDELKYFDESKLTALDKAVTFGEQTAKDRQLYVDMELYNYDPLGSMLFRD